MSRACVCVCVIHVVVRLSHVVVSCCVSLTVCLSYISTILMSYCLYVVYKRICSIRLSINVISKLWSVGYFDVILFTDCLCKG